MNHTIKSIILHDHEVRQLAKDGEVLVVRPIKPQPAPGFLARGVVNVVPQWPHQDGVRWFMADGMSELVPSPYKPGTPFWVKEAFCNPQGKMVWRRADGNVTTAWQPAIRMPKWASRFTVQTESVAVKRVQEITEAEAMESGIEVSDAVAAWRHGGLGKLQPHQKAFSTIWDRHNLKHHWNSNPWCWFCLIKKGDKMEPCYVKCPSKKCGHVFDSQKTFWWGSDWNGDPTVENIRCPKCDASTAPWGDGRRKQWNFDDFKEVKRP